MRLVLLGYYQRNLLQGGAASLEVIETIVKILGSLGKYSDFGVLLLAVALAEHWIVEERS